MKSFTVTSFSAPAVFKKNSQPQPESGQVLIRIAASAVNFADLLLLQGKYQETPELPFTPGLEFAGRVIGCGPGVDPAMAGKRIVVYGGQGGFAEFACVSASRCIPLPDTLNYADAAALQVAWGTSEISLRSRAALRAGETLLVLGAGGGVGLSAVAMGKILGAKVIAAARGKEKLEAARNAGADHLIDTETHDLRETVISKGRADVVYDPVGGPLAEAAFRACNPEARFLLIGFASGDIPEFRMNHALVKNISLVGVNWSGYWNFAPEQLVESGKRLVALAAEGRISANIGHRLPLDQVEEALELLRSRRSTGKVIVETGPQDI